MSRSPADLLMFLTLLRRGRQHGAAIAVKWSSYDSAASAAGMFQQVQVISCVVNIQMLQHERSREKRIRSRCSKSVKRAVVEVMLPSNGQSHNRHGFGVSDVCVAGRNPSHFMSLSITKSATFPRIISQI